MGMGDNLMATGMARGAQERGKRIAFGDGEKIIWDQHSRSIFQWNPNIALPGTEKRDDIEWVNFYKGNRLYNSHDRVANRWIWNMDFRAVPGDLFFTRNEKTWGEKVGTGFIVVEPNAVSWKQSAVNKQWPRERMAQVVDALIAAGHDVVQFSYGEPLLPKVRAVKTPSFRFALAALKRAKLYIGLEGGMHHGAAAVKVPGVAIFGGFIPPQVTGYATHANLTGGAEACGSINPCEHCRKALDAISVDEVLAAATAQLEARAA